MNRSERRKYMKQGVPLKPIMDRTLQDRYEAGFSDGIKHVYKSVLLITAYVAQYHFGLGKKRLPEFMDKLLKTIDAFRTEHLTPNDLYEMRDECKKYGFDIENWK